MNGVQSASRGLTPAAAPEIRWDFFDRGRPVTVTRAPGRLDVMGGIADYSGALVLEMPIAAATWVAAQPSDEPAVVIESDDIEGLGGESTVTLPLAEIVPARPLTYERAHPTRRARWSSCTRSSASRSGTGSGCSSGRRCRSARG